MHNINVAQCAYDVTPNVIYCITKQAPNNFTVICDRGFVNRFL